MIPATVPASKAPGTKATLNSTRYCGSFRLFRRTFQLPVTLAGRTILQTAAEILETIGLLPLYLDVFFGSTIGDCNHDPNADRDHDADHGPSSADAGQDPQFPKCGQNATKQDDESKEIHACPFHDLPPDEPRSVKANSGCVNNGGRPGRFPLLIHQVDAALAPGRRLM